MCKYDTLLICHLTQSLQLIVANGGTIRTVPPCLQDFILQASHLNDNYKLNNQIYPIHVWIAIRPTFLASNMPKGYTKQESRIQQALDSLSELENPNIAAIAKEFCVPNQRLRAR